ncbi:MAG: small ribosomal subunit Rsm22 family protein [Micropepsaceae bacterium]
MTNFALPAAFQRGIENLAADISRSDIAERAEKISQNDIKYKASRSVIVNSADVAAYLTSRGPATYAACAAAFSALAKRAPSLAPLSVLDIGAGPGTASWAAIQQWPNIAAISMVDENEEMLRAAGALCKGADHPALRNARIARAAMSGGNGQEKYDLVVASYAIGELALNDMRSTLQTLWRSAARALVIVEPGTPEGYSHIHNARELLIKAGAEIAAPCPHAGPCPIRAPDWCHFGQRLARTRDHMRAKGARLPFEDEKFSYLALTRGASLERVQAPIINRPRAEKFGMRFRLCDEKEISHRLILKRDKPSYRAVAHKKWGETLPI